MFTLLRGKDTERLEKQREAPKKKRQASEAGARQQRRGGYSRSEASAGRPPPSGRRRGKLGGVTIRTLTIQNRKNPRIDLKVVF